VDVPLATDRASSHACELAHVPAACTCARVLVRACAGILVLALEELRGLLNMKIYVSAQTF